MTDVLGFPLEEAIKILKAEGFEVILKGTFCKKGPAGNDDRVISQKLQSEGSVLLYYSGFKTKPDEM